MADSSRMHARRVPEAGSNRSSTAGWGGIFRDNSVPGTLCRQSHTHNQVFSRFGVKHFPMADYQKRPNRRSIAKREGRIRISGLPRALARASSSHTAAPSALRVACRPRGTSSFLPRYSQSGAARASAGACVRQSPRRSRTRWWYASSRR
jgi:serine/threonine protein kinase HipA of HipAB toxin-antitoxin module